MDTVANTTFKSSIISIGLHGCFIVMGSLSIYQSPMKSLELSGEERKGNIALSSIRFISRKNVSSLKISTITSEKTKVQTVSTRSAAVSSAATGGISEPVGDQEGSLSGVSNGHDFDQGKLFSQIKIFFETRLGSNLNINVEQLIKIKIVLGKDGEILSADLVQGKLDFQVLKKILSVAKNIPLKSFWKSTAPFPQELMIPLILTPN